MTTLKGRHVTECGFQKCKPPTFLIRQPLRSLTWQLAQRSVAFCEKDPQAGGSTASPATPTRSPRAVRLHHPTSTGQNEPTRSISWRALECDLSNDRASGNEDAHGPEHTVAFGVHVQVPGTQRRCNLASAIPDMGGKRPSAICLYRIRISQEPQVLNPSAAR